MPFLFLLFALFVFALFKGENSSAMMILLLIMVALFATYYKPFRDALREYF